MGAAAGTVVVRRSTCGEHTPAPPQRGTDKATTNTYRRNDGSSRQPSDISPQVMPASSRAQRQLQVGTVTHNSKVESSADVGTMIRQARRTAALTQQELGDRIGATRQWVIRLEQGHHGTAISTVLAALPELGLEMVAQFDLPPSGRD